MNCEQVKALLSGYHDLELDNEASSQVEQHLQSCAGCSAELSSFRHLSLAVSSAPTPALGPEAWSRIAARLEPRGAAAVAPVRSSGQTSPSSRKFIGLGLTLALAASLLILAVVRMPPGDRESLGEDSMAAAIDYSTVIKQQAQQSSLALQTLSQRFEGREVAPEDAESVLGYQPAIMSVLPSEARLVSTHLLKLPNCSCAGGQCRCGPKGCNCAATLCQRKDGSEFLVFEHCKTQDVSFGEFQPRIAARDSHDVQFIGTDGRLAVSWVPSTRRLTAIGLKDEAEAHSLVAAVDKVAMKQ